MIAPFFIKYSMKNKLENLVRTISKNAISIVVKSDKELYHWLLDNTTELPCDSKIIERIFFILLGKPDRTCRVGNIKKFISKELKYGYCGNIKNCECFREQISELAKTHDINNIISKRKETWVNKYGVDNVSKSTLIQDKRKDTMSKKDYTLSRARQQEKMEDYGYEQVIDRLSSIVTPLFTREEYIGCFRHNFYKWKCVKCNAIFEGHVDYGNEPRCPTCYPNTKSLAELEIKQWIEEYGITVISGARNIVDPYILDIWLPDHNICIEYNGIYWHSTKHKEPLYHVNKMLSFREHNIHLIQIFEDEWILKKDIVRSRILSYIGLGIKTFARTLRVEPITTTQYKEFINNHHLQGYANATIKLGLLDKNNTIKATMSFAKSRYTSDSYEMIRYCSEGNVIGGASKLFKYFINNYDPETIVTYANRCWSNGKLYDILGFTNVTTDIKNVGYWYFQRLTRYHRSSFTKQKLIQMGYDTTKTEEQIMDELKYLKVYDRGNWKYQWTRS